MLICKERGMSSFNVLMNVLPMHAVAQWQSGSCIDNTVNVAK